jgi:hypothetical protein
MKAGELEGVRQLASDVSDCIVPRFIVPPRSERDPSKPLLFDVEETPDISAALSAHWRERPALIDMSYILDEYGRDHMQRWLPPMFERARTYSVRPIPMALLSDIGAVEAAAFKAAIAGQEKCKFAICVPAGDLVGPEFVVAIQEALNRLGLAPADCIAIVDFGGSNFDDPHIVAPIIGGALETLQDFGPWQRIVFQGTHYPEKNPADHGSGELWPRNEWLAWRQAVKFDPTTAEHMMFGDYAADCSRMVFGSTGAAAIRHLRYTTGSHWLIQRGTQEGNAETVMRAVCQKIVASGHFAGAGFSAADDYIQRTANGSGGPGNATTWRQLNTTHHLTQVVNDLAKVRGVAIARAPARSTEQFMLKV